MEGKFNNMRRLFIILNCLFLCVHLFSLPVLAEQDGEGDGQDPAEVQTEVIDSERDEETEPEPIPSIDSDESFDLAEAVSEDDESDTSSFTCASSTFDLIELISYYIQSPIFYITNNVECIFLTD